MVTAPLLYQRNQKDNALGLKHLEPDQITKKAP